MAAALSHHRSWFRPFSPGGGGTGSSVSRQGTSGQPAGGCQAWPWLTGRTDAHGHPADLVGRQELRGGLCSLPQGRAANGSGSETKHGGQWPGQGHRAQAPSGTEVGNSTANYSPARTPVQEPCSALYTIVMAAKYFIAIISTEY